MKEARSLSYRFISSGLEKDVKVNYSPSHGTLVEGTPVIADADSVSSVALILSAAWLEFLSASVDEFEAVADALMSVSATADVATASVPQSAVVTQVVEVCMVVVGVSRLS